MADLADIQPGQRVLEPSAGTGNLITAILNRFMSGADCGRIVAVEINFQLAEQLRERQRKTLYATDSNYDIRCADFLSHNGELGQFDRIIMNPPFADAADIKHIRHAFDKLKPGGRLVAICANGPRQRDQIMALADQFGTWEDLPADSFAESGTSVNAAMIVLDKPE